MNMLLKVIVAAAAIAALSSPAGAQGQNAQSSAQSATPSCGGFEPAPTLPNGATATRTVIERANTQYDAWAQARTARLQACRAEIDALNAQLAAIYNPAKAELDSVVAAWSAQVEAYNSRNGRRE
jgi:hypothetical protein